MLRSSPQHNTYCFHLLVSIQQIQEEQALQEAIEKSKLDVVGTGSYNVTNTSSKKALERGGGGTNVPKTITERNPRDTGQCIKSVRCKIFKNTW